MLSGRRKFKKNFFKLHGLSVSINLIQIIILIILILINYLGIKNDNTKLFR